MNTLQLECFIAVAENLSFAKAAESMHLSQPAVTKRIQSLEEELDVALFERDTRHVALTFIGKQFYSNAKSILLQEQSAIANVAQLKAEQKQSLVIGSHNTEIYSYLGQVLALVCQETQDIKPDIVDAPFQSLSLSLEAESVDIVIGTYEMMDLAGLNGSAFHMLVPSPVYCITCGKDASRFPQYLQIADLTPKAAEEWFGQRQRITCGDLERYFAQSESWRGMRNAFAKDLLVCDNMNAALCMVKAGLGFMLIPEPDFLREACFDYLPVADARHLNYGYFYNVGNHNPLLRIFRRKLEDYFANME